MIASYREHHLIKLNHLFAMYMQELVLQKHPQKLSMAVKPNAHIRLHSLPYSMDPEQHSLNPNICNIGSSHLSQLITIRGTVVKAGPVKMFEAQKVFFCNKCKHK